MIYYASKVLVSAILVLLVSEVARRSSSWGGIVASLPAISVLAIGWLYFETRDVAKIAAFARSTFWYVLPSLVFFLVLPPLLKTGQGFAVSLAIALGATAAAYLLMAFFLNKSGVKL